jgi:hypothetical protein
MKGDPQKAYFVSLLERVCEKASEIDYQCELKRIEGDMHQQRQLKSLDSGIIDVVWTVTSKDREKHYLPVRIPLTKGLIGYRIAIVNNASRMAFSSSSSLQTLKDLKHVQGHDWPDSEILAHNGFNLSTTTWNSTLYKSLNSGHFDVLLRGALEITTEIEIYPNPNLSIEPKNAFYYPSAVYFFVSKKKPHLAALLEAGLMALIDDGSFDTLLFEFAPHKKALDSLLLENRIVHVLDNPLLPAETPLDIPELWFYPISRYHN